ncbi:MAG: glycosyltransferase family 39 protein [Dyella sp.]|uniref:glycosyltransferase family 39 protein n=1 Tax=Dyella sp. TaxID=1869338 RepID=UPI003F82024C
MQRRLIGIAAALLMLLFAIQIVSVVRQESLSWDEGDHIFAGYMAWKTHDYRYNPEHPPLMKALATLPLLGLPLKVPADQQRYFKEEAYLDGRELLFHNPPYSVEALTLRVRLAAGIVALLLAALVFCAAWEMFGMGAGLLALALLTFDPNILAHSALVTTDIGVSCFLLAAVYTFYRYRKKPSISRLLVAAIAAGLALATKHSAILLIPMLGALALLELFYPLAEQEVRASLPRRTLHLGGALIAIGAIALLVLWSFYGFRYAARPGTLQLTPSLVDYVKPLSPLEAKGVLWLAHWHVLPEAYLYGLTDVRSMANGMSSFIFGKVFEHGVAYYFPAVLTIKSTLGWLAATVLALVALATGRLRQWRAALFLLLPALVYFVVAMTSSLNIGARHILPVYVFLTLLAAGGCWAWVWRAGAWSRPWAAVVAVLLCAHVGSSLRAYPNYMAYSNELWGGPMQTYKVLTDSNADWAQQLLAVKQYLDQRGIKQCWFAYFADPFLRPADYGIPCKPMPTPDAMWERAAYEVPEQVHGPVLISAGDWTWYEMGSSVLNPYRSFQALAPAAVIQGGVLVYEGDFHLPLAAALSHVQRSAILLEQKNLAGALAEAQKAAAIAPGDLQPQEALGDALAATGDKQHAREAYAKALQVAATMEDGARQTWGNRLQKKLQALAP